jgi:hypothetical protein
VRSAKPRRTAFVPRVVFEVAAVASVIPLCACGGRAIEQPAGDASADVALVGVANAMADAGEILLGVAAILGDAGDFQNSVGVECFDGDCEPGVTDAGVSEAGVSEAGFTVADASFGDADAGGNHVPLGVALAAFDGGKS